MAGTTGKLQQLSPLGRQKRHYILFIKQYTMPTRVRRVHRKHTTGGKRKRSSGSKTSKRVGGHRRRMHGRGWLSAIGTGIGKLGGMTNVLDGLGGIATTGSGIAGMVANNKQARAIDEERDRQAQAWKQMQYQ